MDKVIGLDEAAREYANGYLHGSSIPTLYCAFIAGGEWQQNQVDGWISVDERLPESERPVIVAAKFAANILTCTDTCYYKSSVKKWYDSSNDLPLFDDFIKFWQPLPPPPKASIQKQSK